MEKYLIFITFVVILFFYINSTRENLKNINKYKNYRLSDLVIGIINRNEKKNFNKYHKIYPDTIASKYIEKIKNLPDEKKWKNIDILDKIIENRPKKYVNLHLRIGDVIGKYKKKNNTFEYLYDDKYFFQPQVYEKIINKLKNNGVRSIHIFYGSHRKLTNDTFVYLKIIKDILDKNNIKVIDNSKGNPDDDFTEMSNSKIFIKSGGGFSSLISKLVKKRGGIVIDPTEYQ